jgi:hypothetical protein
MSEEERQKMASTGIRFGEEELRTVTSAAHSLGRGRYQENLIHFRDGSEEKELQETFVFMIVVLERERARDHFADFELFLKETKSQKTYSNSYMS